MDEIKTQNLVKSDKIVCGNLENVELELPYLNNYTIQKWQVVGKIDILLAREHFGTAYQLQQKRCHQQNLLK